MNKLNNEIQNYSYNIQELTADKQEITYQKGIGEGRRIQRLQLIEGDPTFNVAAERIDRSQPRSKLNSFVRRFTHVKVNTQSGSIDLNIRSTAKRLGITPKEVVDISKQGEEAIAILQGKAKIRKAAIEKYNVIVKRYVKQRGELSQKAGLKTKLKPETLFKAIQQGLSITEKGSIGTKHRIDVGDHTFLATKNLDKLYLVKTELGSGAFGTVFKTVELTNAEIKALKFTSNASRALEDLKNEHKVLTDLNVGGPYDGIPPAPSEITVITGSNSADKKGFCDMTLMSSDLGLDGPFASNFQRMEVKDRLKLIRQLLNGLEHIHKKGYCHGDIKPANCLAQTTGDGIPKKIFIADHGSTSKGIPKSYTEGYRPNDYKRTVDSAKKGDVYALAKTLIEVLGETNNFTRESDLLDHEDDYKRKITVRLESYGIPKSVAEVLIKGLAPENKRPTAAELRIAFDLAALSTLF